jgi:hypothetical protein
VGERNERNGGISKLRREIGEVKMGFVQRTKHGTQVANVSPRPDRAWKEIYG